MIYARIALGRVAELLTPAEGVALADCYHADIVAACVPVPPGVEVAAGDCYAAGAFSPAPRQALTAEYARQMRDALLARSDWRLMPDSPLTSEQCAAWVAYRRALRDWPQQPGWPDLAPPAPPVEG